MPNRTWGTNVVSSDGAAPSENVRVYQVDCGALPAATTKNVAHGIVGLDLTKVVRLWGVSHSASATNTIPLPSAHATAEVALRLNATNVVLITDTDQSVYLATYVFIEVLED